MYNEESAMVVI